MLGKGHANLPRVGFKAGAISVRLQRCWRVASAVDHDPTVALAKAGGILGRVGQRTSQGTGAPGEALLKMVNALLSAKIYSSR